MTVRHEITLDLSATGTSDAWPVPPGSDVTIYYSTSGSGSPEGTLEIHTSGDGTTFGNDSTASGDLTSPSGSDLSQTKVHFSNAPGDQWRLDYSRTGGSGTLSAVILVNRRK